MARNVSALRLQVESALAGRIPAPFAPNNSNALGSVPAGVPQADGLTGGLPRGGITEICGPNCSGRTSLLLTALASRTAEGEACAFIDGRDAFDPYSAERTGVQLQRLLWVRCRNLDHALRATDLILQGGGFGLVALDLGDMPPETVRHVPLSLWFRFRRAVEHTPTIFLILEQEPHAKTCASLVLGMEPEGAHWVRPARDNRDFACHPHACLFAGSCSRAEVVRSRLHPAGFSRFDRGSPAVSLESKCRLSGFEVVTPLRGNRIGRCAAAS